jgi:DNA-binding NarL/FixJ family response regulator
MELLVSTTKNLVIIKTYQNGQELVQSKNIHKSDIVIIDIEMPILNGLEAAKILNRKFPHTPLIALTMHKEKIYLDEMIKSGFKAFIYKPEVSQTLVDVINKVLENKFVFPQNLNMYHTKRHKDEKFKD